MTEGYAIYTATLGSYPASPTLRAEDHPMFQTREATLLVALDTESADPLFNDPENQPPHWATIINDLNVIGAEPAGAIELTRLRWNERGDWLLDGERVVPARVEREL